MDQIHPMAVLLEHRCNGAGMVDVTGDHQPCGIGLAAADPRQPLLGLQQHLLADAAGVGKTDGPTQIARTPAFSVFGRQR